LTVQVHHVTCPNCGAPIGIAAGRFAAICIFCNASLRVEPTSAPGVAPTLATAEVSREDIERAKQLLLDGERPRAVEHYATVACVPRSEAEAAVEQVFLTSVLKLYRDQPINLIGFLMYLGLVALGATAAGIAGGAALEEPGLWLVVALGSAFSLWMLYRLARHLRSTWVLSFGADGRGRVLKCAVLRRFPERGTTLAAVLFEVTPGDGSPPFLDQETLTLSAQGAERLVVGNTVRVRFDRGRTLVFPTSPIEVV